LLDDKTVLFDTVDKAVSGVFIENIQHVLGDRNLDYVVIQHMEPDHSATLTELLLRYPDIKIICNEKMLDLLDQFFDVDMPSKTIVVEEGSIINTGHHELTFIMAPMVHWPEVMVSYETSEKVLFSADAFGKFGANDVDDDWACEARRYYFGIVGKYGVQVQSLLKKAANLDIRTICPLHGPVLNNNIGYYVEKYNTWSSYLPEDQGVVIAYSSIYGHTKDACIYLANKLKENGVKVVLADLARSDMHEVLEDAFRYDCLVLASVTYNNDIFPYMKSFINKLVERNYQNRHISLIENGSWAPCAAKVMASMFEKSKNITINEKIVTITSSLNETSTHLLDELALTLIK
jgi:flavorubredoxin